MHRELAVLLALSGTAPLQASDFSISVPLKEKGTSTFYVAAEVGGEHVDFLVDTGAGYTTMNRGLIKKLKRSGHAKWMGEIEGLLANGDTCDLPVYKITSIRLGGDCLIQDIEVAETPANTRNLLGLSALRKTAPFTFSLEPAELKLSNCGNVVARATASPLPAR